MKWVFLLLFGIFLVIGNANAQIFRCEASSGRDAEYINNSVDAMTRGCKRLSSSSPDSELWKFVISNEKKTLDIYITKRASLVEGKFQKTWFLWSYSKPRLLVNGTSFQSSKHLLLFDCISKRSAIRQAIYSNGTIAEGDAVRSISMSDGELEFDDAPPGSLGEAILDQVCGSAKR